MLTIARTVLDCVRDKKHGYFSFENARPFVWVRSQLNSGCVCCDFFRSLFFGFVFVLIGLLFILQAVISSKWSWRVLLLLLSFVDHILHRIIFEDVRSTVMCKIHLSKHFLNLVSVYLTNRQVVDLLCVACFCVIDIWVYVFLNFEPIFRWVTFSLDREYHIQIMPCQRCYGNRNLKKSKGPFSCWEGCLILMENSLKYFEYNF